MSSIQEMRHPNQKVAGKVEALSAAGFNQKTICDYLQIDQKTLRKHYRHELDVAMMDRTITVAEALFKQATDAHKPSVTAQIFWLKCQSRGGWIESGEELEELKKKDISKVQIEVLPARKRDEDLVSSSEEDDTDETIQ